MICARRRLVELFVLNVLLQLFDAVATYQGLRIGLEEANPILVAAFQRIGTAPALIAVKSLACALLCLLVSYRHHPIVVPSLKFLAASYVVMSLFPWMAKFLGLLPGLL